MLFTHTIIYCLWNINIGSIVYTLTWNLDVNTDWPLRGADLQAVFDADSPDTSLPAAGPAGVSPDDDTHTALISSLPGMPHLDSVSINVINRTFMYN